MTKLILILTFLLALPLSAQTQDNKDLNKAANEGLREQAALANAMPRQNVGLTAEEVARAQLLPPIGVSLVPLDALKTYKTGGDARALLRESGAVFFVVAVDGDVRSSITVAKLDGHWKAVEIGRVKLATAVERVRAHTSNVTGIVTVPALNLTFVASDSGGTLRLTSLQNAPAAELAFGESDTADRIFARLVPLAQRHNGDPT